MNSDAPPPPFGTGEIVLLVEDDSSLRRMAGIQLRSLGYTVFEAEDGQSALRILKSERQIDLLLTDVVLEGLSGAQLGRKARELRPELKLMYMSGYPRVEGAGRNPVHRDIILLRKPFRRRDIAISVRKALEGG